MKKLFLLDGMALVYRAHFALMSRPIFTSKGVNTSALYGFTQTLLEILKKQQPTHIAVAFDTEAPTQRHAEFAQYKATRQAMPEDLSQALPHVRRMIEAFRIAVLTCDGYEADDIIGTLVRRAEKEGFQSYMVTPDKDFGQLITENVFLYKPSRMGDGVEVLGLPEIRNRWGISRPEQVVDVLALMGDSSDNIPGVPGVGEKTASKLIAQFGTVENVLAHTEELTDRLKTAVVSNREQALLSKRLATIICDAPCPVELEKLKVQSPDDEQLKRLLIEFEFNSLGRRLFGEEFKAGRGYGPAAPPKAPATKAVEDFVLVGEREGGAEEVKPAAAPNLKTIADVAHDYRLVTTPEQRRELIATLEARDCICLDLETTSLDPKEARPLGLAFSFAPQTGYYVALPPGEEEGRQVLEEFRPVLESERIDKVGHNLKFDLSVLKWRGISVRGKLFDTMVAHSLIEPDMRHGMDYLAEVYLGYTPMPITKLIGEDKGPQLNFSEVPLDKAAEYAAEDADVTWQLRAALEPLLKEKGQERVFYEIEAPLIPVLVDMEYEGIRVDTTVLAEFGAQLAKEMDHAERTICRMAGTAFNLNSPRQLGQVLFDILKICEAPKKTRSGQYATDEQTLAALAPDHEIVQHLLEYRTAAKLKSTYADALPPTVSPRTGRVHTTFNQVMTTTGRLNSQDPNLQNIPIRTERGQEIRKAFVPRDAQHRLLSADYSQIELRIIAALSGEAGLLEAFRTGVDVHTATAARVYGLPLDMVTAEMRRKAKMVNYGIAYGISAFGLAQRLGIARKEAAEIIAQYFKQFPGIRKYMDQTIALARRQGYVETVTGRRRYIRDIRSLNNTVRSGAERNAINAPIQGTAADMIKIAMINIHNELQGHHLKTRMLLQVHDELVFDLFEPEEAEVRGLVAEKMKSAIKLDVPIEVEIGAGDNWLEAH
ncbi:DNA polymerase I [Verrucomicrobia bacterium]|nr:DNA polymerase I [Verrucomicrobiota bacterium]